MILREYEAPVAYSMVELASQFSVDSTHAISKYVCLWTAFNSIYVSLAERAGRMATLVMNAEGLPQTRAFGRLKMPTVAGVTERELLRIAFGCFAAPTKTALLESESTKFFADRIPNWRGCPIERDAWGQRLNGVINVGYTTCRDYPVWAPIDVAEYGRYLEGCKEEEPIDLLSCQILEVLYTVRNNTLHGGKRADDANDLEVVGRATPLLEIVVSAFLEPR